MADEPRTLVVAVDGSGEYTRIQAALEAARRGDTVLVRAGTYTEDVHLRQGVTLRGEGPERTRLAAATANALRADNVTDVAVTDFAIDGAGKTGHSAVYFNAASVTFSGCVISGAAMSGIEALNKARLTLRGSTVRGNQQAGVLIHGESEGVLEANTLVENGTIGLAVQERGRLTARNNTVRGNQQAGVLIHGESEGVLETNTLAENGVHGIAVQERGRLTARNNTVRGNHQSGVFIYQDSEGMLEANTLAENGTIGIAVQERGRLTAHGNTVRGNQNSGVFIYQDSEGVLEANTITENGLHGITVQEQGRLTARNNTIVRNIEIGVWVHKEGHAELRHNIITGHESKDASAGVRTIGNAGDAPAAAVTLHRNCVWGNRKNYVGQVDAASDISADPRFVNPAGGDYHLLPDSPCIAADDHGADLGAFPFTPPPPPPALPTLLPQTSLHAHLLSLAFTHVACPVLTPSRPASWLRGAAAAGWPLPLGLARDLGLLLSHTPDRLTISKPAHLPFDEDTSVYLNFLQRLAAAPLVRQLPRWSPPLSDAVLSILLARLVEGLALPDAYRLPPGPAGLLFARELAFQLDHAVPADLWRATPPTLRPVWRALLPPDALARIERNLRALDPDELRFLARYGTPLGGAPDPRDLLDLLALTHLPPPARLALSQTLHLLPRVSDTRILGGLHTYPEGGYAGLARQGSLDSLLPTELAYDTDLFLHRVLNQEALYYGRERPRARRRELAYLILQTGFGLGGDGLVLARALLLALAQALRRRGYEVLYSLAGKELSEPRSLDKPGEVARLLYHTEDVLVDGGRTLLAVLQQLRGWREVYRGRQVVWVLSEWFDADEVDEHAGLYRALRAEAGQQAWYVRVGAGDGNGRRRAPVTARHFERWEVVETGRMWERGREAGRWAEPVAGALPAPPMPRPKRELRFEEWQARAQRIQTVRVLKGHTGTVWGLAFSPDGRWLASGSADKTVRLWDVESGRELRTLGVHTDLVNSVAFSPDGRWLASGSNTVRLWDVARGREVRVLEGHTKLVHSVAFSPDGHWLASASWDNTVRLWDLETGREVRILAGHTNYVHSATFSPDGRWLASGAWDRTVRLWDVATGREMHVLRGHTSNVYSVSFSPDGHWLASGSDDKTVQLWDVAAGRKLRVLEGHTTYVNDVVFSPDGHWLASGAGDRTVSLWEVKTGRRLRVLQAHTDGLASVTFSPDGRWLASGSNTVRLWDTSPLLEEQPANA